MTRAAAEFSEWASLEGRAALVTGGAGHMGSVISEAFLKLGAAVGVLDVDAERCKELAGRLEADAPGKVEAIVCDLSNEGETRSSATRFIEDRGGLDILVHCAAMMSGPGTPGWATSFADETSSSWREELEVGLTSAFVLSQTCAPALARSGRGSIVLIGSIYGFLGPVPDLYVGTEMAKPAGYAASKGGLLQMCRYLACVLAPEVRVNAISPGGIWRGQPESFQERYVARTPLKRMGKEEDIVGAAVFLASDLSAYVTGHNLVVDGGWSAW